MHTALTTLLRRRPAGSEFARCDGPVHDDTTLIRAVRGALTRTQQIRRVAATLCGADVGWECPRCTRRAERLVPELIGEPAP